MRLLILVVVIQIFCVNIVYGQPDFLRPYPDTLNKTRLNTTIAIESAVYLGGLSFLSYIWYADQDRVPFHFYDDSKGYLQIDKCGHAFGAYRYSYMTYYALRRCGVPKNKALIFGGPMGLVFQTPIEIFDGLYEGWGFSWYDMIANTLGSAIFTTQEALLDDQVFIMKFSYSPSIYPSYHDHFGETHLQRFFYDYNGHTYWLSGNLRSISGIERVPRWISLSFGYSANGMIYEFENPTYYKGDPFPYLPRYRQYLLSLDVDFTKIHTNSKFLRILFRGLNLVKVPFPALEYNRVDGFSLNPLYF